MGDLFDDDPPGPKGPPYTGRDMPRTSFDAPVGLDVSKKQKMVYDFVFSLGPPGCTELDAQIYFKDHGSTIRSRFKELEKKDYLYRTGEERSQKRPDKDGFRWREVWACTCFRDKKKDEPE